MATPTLEDILTPTTEAEVTEQLLAELSGAGFPVDTWAPLSLPRALVAVDARVLCGVRTDGEEGGIGADLVTIAKAGLITRAGEVGDEWLDLLIWNVFREERTPAATTRRLLTLHDEGGAPYSVDVGALTVKAASGHVFVNLTGGNLEPAGDLTLTFEAEAPGSAYNGDLGPWEIVGNPLPGTSIDDTGGAPSIAISGRDKETNAAFVDRAIRKWSTLGNAANDDGYIANARKASAEVTRVLVRAHYPAEGQVTLVVAGTAGPVAGLVVSSVYDFVRPRAPNTDDLFVASAVAQSISVAGTVYVPAANKAAAMLQAASNLAKLASTTPIGGVVKSERISKAIVDALPDVDLADLDLTSPTGDVALAANAVPSFVDSLDWEEV